MNPRVDKVFNQLSPYHCPKCGAELECFFHERDSTSDSMDCPKCYWWAHSAWDGEWYCSDDPEGYDPQKEEEIMESPSPQQQVLLDKLKKHLKETERHYVFEPICNDTIDRLRKSIEQILQRFVIPEQDLSGHIEVTIDEKKADLIHVGPKEDAPQWVFDLFEHISKSINENKEDGNS